MSSASSADKSSVGTDSATHAASGDVTTSSVAAKASAGDLSHAASSTSSATSTTASGDKATSDPSTESSLKKEASESTTQEALKSAKGGSVDKSLIPSDSTKSSDDAADHPVSKSVTAKTSSTTSDSTESKAASKQQVVSKVRSGDAKSSDASNDSKEAAKVTTAKVARTASASSDSADENKEDEGKKQKKSEDGDTSDDSQAETTKNTKATEKSATHTEEIHKDDEPGQRSVKESVHSEDSSGISSSDDTDSQKDRQSLERRLLSNMSLGEVAAVSQDTQNLADAALESMLTSEKKGKDLFGTASLSYMRIPSSYGLSLLHSNFVIGVTNRSERAVYGAFIDGSMGSIRVKEAAKLGRMSFGSYGAGMLGRYDFRSPFYVSAMVRAGRSTASAKNTVQGEETRYKLDRTYVSGALGGGMHFEINSDHDLDLYTKYYATYLGRGSVRANSVEASDHALSATHAEAWRTGFKVSTRWTDTLTTCVGAAYQKGFGGNAIVDGAETDAAHALRGHTAIGALDLHLEPSEHSPLTLHFSLKGYVGAQRGVGGYAVINYRY